LVRSANKRFMPVRSASTSSALATLAPPAKPVPDACGLACPSLIRSLIQLRSETFGVRHTGHGAEVTDPLEPRRTQVHRLGKRVGAEASPSGTPERQQILGSRVGSRSSLSTPASGADR
jgi:hypothetical protein